MTCNIVSTPIYGLYEIYSSPFFDERGLFHNLLPLASSSFRKAWDSRPINQVNLSSTSEIGVLRGLHLQQQPYQDAKIVTCIRGCVFDVAVDLRLASSSYGQWHSIELSECSRNSFLIPEGCAHGFQVLQPYSQLLYIHSAEWSPGLDAGVRYDDPSLCIPWPLNPRGVSKRDLCLPFLDAYQ